MSARWSDSARSLVNLHDEEKRERILGESARANASLMCRRVDAQRSFRQRSPAMQEKHTQEQADLSLQHVLELEMELSRAVPEAESLFNQSKLYRRRRCCSQARAADRHEVHVETAAQGDRKTALDALLAEKGS
jgi:hypothetical protein